MTAMIGVREEGSYDDYCAQLHMVSDQISELASLTSRHASWKKKEDQGSAPLRTTSPRPRSSDNMDWTPTTSTSSAYAKEPSWANKAEMERRRDERACLRCGKTGHFVRDCHAKLKPARKVSAARATTRLAKVKDVSSDSDESGKE